MLLSRPEAAASLVHEPVVSPCHRHAVRSKVRRGHLRLAPVSCVVALYTAEHDRNAIGLHLINPKAGRRIRTVTIDTETDE
jgi:non-homologous end joining protein Ku